MSKIQRFAGGTAGRLVCLAGLLAATAAGQAGGPASWTFFQPVKPPRAVQVMAHRGMARAAPENTRPAIELAIEDGVEWVEVDLRLSRDGQHVVFHDETLDERASGQGRVDAHTLAELQAVDAGAWFAPRFAGTRLLSLAECLTLAKDRINLYLDCKQVDPARLAADVLAAGMERQVVVYGDSALLAEVRSASGERLALMTKWRPDMEPAQLVEALRPAIVEIDATNVTPEVCRTFHEAGVLVQAKVLDLEAERGFDKLIDTPITWDQMCASGVDFLQTDWPERLIVHRTAAAVNQRPVAMALHRGASRYTPENTLPAIRAADRLGADYIEIDVRTTADERQFLLHDGTLDRTTNGRGPIRAASSPTVAGLDAGDWFARSFRGTKVPTLDEALAIIPVKTRVYFDAKNITPEQLVAALRRHKLVERTIVFQAPGYLNKVRALEPKLRTLCPLLQPADLPRLAERLRPTAVDARWGDLSPELIGRAHQLGVQVFADARDDTTVDEYRQAIRWGIDVIQTDYPLRLWRAMELEASSE